jgi:hypothetical protein
VEWLRRWLLGSQSQGRARACADVHAGAWPLWRALYAEAAIHWASPSLPASGGVHGHRGRRKVAISCVCVCWMDLCEPCPLCLLAFAFLVPSLLFSSRALAVLGLPCVCQVEFLTEKKRFFRAKEVRCLIPHPAFPLLFCIKQYSFLFWFASSLPPPPYTQKKLDSVPIGSCVGGNSRAAPIMQC